MKPTFKKKLVLFGIAILLISGFFGNLTKEAEAKTAWNAMPTTGFDAQVNGVSAISEIAVWACGDDDDNSGQISFFDGWNWSGQTIPTTEELNDIYMFSSTVGIAVGDTDITRGTILYTSDGGTTWTQSTDANIPVANLNGVCMASATVGWVVGNDVIGTETVLYTADGGVNWAAQTAAATGNIDYNDVVTASTSMATLVGDADGTRGTVFYTSDTGSTWTQSTDADLQNYDFNGVYMAGTGGDDIWIVGDSDSTRGQILRSNAIAGDNISFDTPLTDAQIPDEDLYGIDGTSVTVFWVSGDNDTMLETDDGSDIETNSVPSTSNLTRRISVESVDHIYGACSGAAYVIASFDIVKHDIKFDIGIAISISIDSSADYDFGTVLPEVVYTSADPERVVNVKTNNTTGWILYIKGLGDFKDGDAPANTCALGVLEWSDDSGGAWADVSTTDSSVESSGSATAAAGVDSDMMYRLNTVPYGTTTDGTDFVATITYTAATQ
ncbi:WD40/YVTN/BNR-like repeat-containing protein [Patescibacteria group bacterium]